MANSKENAISCTSFKSVFFFFFFFRQSIALLYVLSGSPTGFLGINGAGVKIDWRQEIIGQNRMWCGTRELQH